MRVIYRVLVIFTFYCVTVEACPENETCTIKVEDENIQALLAGMRTFTDKVLRVVYTDEYVVGNVAFSPLAIYFSLALVLFGSTGGTQTLLAQALGFPADTDWQILEDDLTAIRNALEVTRTEMIRSEKVVYEMVFLGQALFLQNSFTFQEPYEQFLQTIRAQYFFVDFQLPRETMLTIQQWVYTQTSQKVNVDVNEPFPSTSRLVFANSAFFTAKWEDDLFPTDKYGTGEFYSVMRNAIGNVATMSTASAKTLQYLEVANYYSCIRLPYKGGDNDMFIVLPHEDYAISNFVQQFDMNDYDYAIKNSKPTLVYATVPKFICVWTSTFARFLARIGLRDLFEAAELGNMIADLQAGIQVGELLHAAAVQFDASGTTVSTLSTNSNAFGVSLMAVESPQPAEIPIEFVVARPFLMYIHNRQTGLPIFAALMRDI